MAFVPNWSPTAYYNINDKVIYGGSPYLLTVTGSTPGVFGVPPPSNPTAWVVTSIVGGVSSISSNGANPLINAVNFQAGTGISISPNGQNIQINNLNPAVPQQGIISLGDTNGAQSTSYTPQLLVNLTSNAGSNPTGSFATVNTGKPPTATTTMTLNLEVPPVPTFTQGSGITVSGSGTTAVTIANSGVLALTQGSGISISGSNSNLTVGNTGVLALTQGSGIALSGNNTNYTVANDGVLELTQGPGISIVGNKTNYTITAPVYQGTYYKSVAQNLTSGNTDITFDLTGIWNNTGGFITHVNGTTDFTVVDSGLYQLEFNATVLANNGAWNTATNRTCNIDITRSPTAESAVIISSSLQGVQSYGQSVSATVFLLGGDVINLRIGNTYTGGTPTPPQAASAPNTSNPLDLNTFFTWRFIR